jgi:hypothetical protein
VTNPTESKVASSVFISCLSWQPLLSEFSFQEFPTLGYIHTRPSGPFRQGRVVAFGIRQGLKRSTEKAVVTCFQPQWPVLKVQWPNFILCIIFSITEIPQGRPGMPRTGGEGDQPTRQRGLASACARLDQARAICRGKAQILRPPGPARKVVCIEQMSGGTSVED